MAQNRPVYHTKALGNVNDDFHLTLIHFSRKVKSRHKSRSYCNHATSAFKVLQMASQACDVKHLTPSQPCSKVHESKMILSLIIQRDGKHALRRTKTRFHSQLIANLNSLFRQIESNMFVAYSFCPCFVFLLFLSLIFVFL